MTRVFRNGLMVLAVAGLGRQGLADSGSSNMTQELVHVGTAMVQVSSVLLLNLKAHEGEKSIGTYASRIAEANLKLVKVMRPPTQARPLHGYLQDMAEHFSRAVDYYVKGEHTRADEEGKKVFQVSQKARREIEKLENSGAIPKRTKRGVFEE